MKNKLLSIKNLLKNKQGAVFILMAFVALTLFVFIFAAFETIKVFSVYFTVETNLQRLANNAVERNIDDAYRADGYNYLITDSAIQDFYDDFHWYTTTKAELNDFKDPEGIIYGCKFGENDEFLYMIDIESVTADRITATLTCKGTLYIANSVPGMLDKFVFNLDIDLKSTNFRVDDGQNGSLNAFG